MIFQKYLREHNVILESKFLKLDGYDVEVGPYNSVNPDSDDTMEVPLTIQTIQKTVLTNEQVKELKEFLNKIERMPKYRAVGFVGELSHDKKKFIVTTVK